MRQVLAAVLATMLLAGCTESPETPDAHDDHDDHDHGNGTIETVLAAALATDVINGTAPLLVHFNITAENATANATWSLDFGDGNQTNGTSLPATANHTFGVGNHTVMLFVQDGNRTSQADLTVQVEAAVTEPARPIPEKLHFTFGESLGCAGDFLQAGGADCISALGGPDASGVDGFWVELNDAYWGYTASTTVDNTLGDSDCYWTDGDFTVLGSGNQGGSPCGGVVPDGTVWLFLYSYAEPATGQTLTFSL